MGKKLRGKKRCERKNFAKRKIFQKFQLRRKTQHVTFRKGQRKAVATRKLLLKCCQLFNGCLNKFDYR